jgi:HSP20 family molecular chaperone IbpA
VKNYASRFHDPFYKVKDPGSEFWETSTEYRLRAHIPEHEKQNISVRIQPDRVTVTGKRTYTDDLKEENRKLSSSNLQTFREEYAFDTNVQHNFTTQERNGDWVEFIIPKAGIYSKKA